MKIKIDNKTDYDSKWLRIIFNRCVRMVNRRMRKLKNVETQFRVKVVYKKSLTNWTGGRAWLCSNFVHLEIPRPPEKMLIEDWTPETIERLKRERKEVLKGLPESVAKTMVHELYHCYGYNHDDKEMFFPRKKIWIESTYKYDWTTKYPAQFKIEKPKPEKPKVDIQMKRYYRILDLLKEWQCKAKRAQNQIKKYFAKKRYYEKVLVSAGKVKKD